ncbi:MAG TPA: TRAP transporter large permease [Roseiflexaceae bacterium]|nr:TRAP transporter large permease [Roseiflexaceae bacterium]
MTSIFLFVALFVFLFMGMPIAIALGLSSVLTIVLFANDSLASLALKLFETSQHYTLLAIPFFVLSGTLLTTGGVARRLIRFANTCVGHLPGGLAIASVMACMLFAAISGSSPATVVAIGSIVIGGMVQHGYSKGFAAGVIANAGTLGILIPPSIVMVVYCAATNVSVGRMFLAGILPGILLGLCLMIAVYVSAKRLRIRLSPKSSWSERLNAGADSIWGLLLIFIIMGGIYSGAFTPTEAAAVSVIYALIVAVGIYRDLKIRDLPRVLGEAGKVTVMLMFIIANAFLFAHVLTSERIPQQISELILRNDLEPWMFLLVVNILLLVAGNFMEPSAIMLILAPILFPIAIRLGIDPVHLGIIFVINMEIGMITPPVGLNLFVTSGITGENLMWVVRHALPWTSILLAFLLVITYVPWISTVVPNYVFGPEQISIPR